MDRIALFKEFHQHPELSYQEYRTTERIRLFLEESGIEILPLDLKTGLVAIIRGGNVPADGKKTYAFRCDIDGLPITEDTGLSYQSMEEGKMHACGHDIHITTGLQVAYLLQQSASHLAADYLVIFQPGEESSNGALKIIDTGVLSTVEAIVSLHVNPELESGVLGIQEHAVTSSVDAFKLVITGIGAHGAKPENSIDPILAASHLVTSLQSIVSRNISPLAPAVVSVTRFESGHTWNIIPETATLEGTIRTSDANTRKLIEDRFRQLVQGIDSSFGTRTAMDFITSNPATDNHPSLCQLARQVAEQQQLKTTVTPLSMVGEDFAYYQEQTKGIIIWVGSGIGPNLHNPRFTADPDILTYIPEYFAALLTSLPESAI